LPTDTELYKKKSKKCVAIADKEELKTIFSQVRLFNTHVE